MSVVTEKFSVIYRVWHWLMAFAVTGLLATVALRKTFLSWRTNSELIRTKLLESGTEITESTAKMLAKAIRAPMWEWHYIFAAILGFSLLIKIYMLFTKKDKTQLSKLITSSQKDKFKQVVYFILSMSIILMVVSGSILYFYEFLGLIKKDIHWIKDLHENTMYSVLVFILLHLAGIIRHEISTREGIISKMIHGER